MWWRSNVVGGVPLQVSAGGDVLRGRAVSRIWRPVCETQMEARGDGLMRRARDGASRWRRRGAASRRRCGWRHDYWRHHLDLGTDGRSSSNDERRGYGVNIHVDLLNEAIDDSDSVFAWKELAMSHWLFPPSGHGACLDPTARAIFSIK